MLNEQIQKKIDLKTKPLKALGDLEQLAFQIATVQQTLTPQLTQPHLFVFAADHGITAEGVSAYPSEVTFQMVVNFLNGGAAINVFCRQHEIRLKIVDAGVKGDLPTHPDLIHQKQGQGSNNMLHEKALTDEQLEKCLEKGADVVLQVAKEGCNCIGFGEMGIGNTSSSSLILAALLQQPVEDYTGRGTGVNDEQLKHKVQILKAVQDKHKKEAISPLAILQCYGGLEIAQMVGAMKEAYRNNMLILIDGFIATAAFMILYFEDQTIKNNAVFCHMSGEKAHKDALDYLNVKPLVQLNLRVGEGTGCAIAYPIIESAVRFLTEMASFEDANVSNKD